MTIYDLFPFVVQPENILFVDDAVDRVAFPRVRSSTDTARTE